MKQTTIIAVLLFVVSIFLWSCQSKQEEKGNSYVRTASYQNPADTCLSLWRSENGDPIAYQINEDCAIRYMEKYHEFVDGVNETLERHHSITYSNPAEKLVYGAQVDLDELKRVITWSELNPGNDSLWIMMGIIPSTMVSDSTELVFALKTTAVINQTETWRYFDFTRPCPTGCPDRVNL